MAFVKKNIVTDGLSGKLGKNLVFRQSNGKTVVSSSPTPTGISSEKQVDQRKLFTKAAHYAQTQMADPVFGEKYRMAAKAKGIRTPNNLAVQDYLRPPVIETLNANAYHGEIGDEIIIEAYDDLEVEKVSVEIYHTDGSLVEKGMASTNGNPFEWHYAASVANAEYGGDKVVVKAFDHPGNETLKELVLTSQN
ncbi:hypothetical protein DWB61_13555 [Ancylomarina euxinus]|uniref:Uncharacterized protein n=1 Tax=Ancylomarina euxinus TaxID=2283627 RepID=A0A425XYS9_9BACT|nr:hypothetical protein [Ancylomarina euxinus]MCZ4695748.1 hypothetical protein [Ancylomarina euxinus]MUP16201.1 hypothetical protein [Ancylomarina euxinus]RRG20061.1 hypothetical protein DWB61_13555 [Ancylomarina euxinus]